MENCRQFWLLTRASMFGQFIHPLCGMIRDGGWGGGGADTRFTLSEYILILCKIQVRLKPIHAQYHLNTLV